MKTLWDSIKAAHRAPLKVSCTDIKLPSESFRGHQNFTNPYQFHGIRMMIGWDFMKSSSIFIKILCGFHEIPMSFRESYMGFHHPGHLWGAREWFIRFCKWLFVSVSDFIVSVRGFIVSVSVFWRHRAPLKVSCADLQLPSESFRIHQNFKKSKSIPWKSHANLLGFHEKFIDFHQNPMQFS